MIHEVAASVSDSAYHQTSLALAVDRAILAILPNTTVYLGELHNYINQHVN